MVPVPAICYTHNPPAFDVKCYNYGYKVQVSFTHPFKGAAYFKGYPFDPLCSFRASAASYVLEIGFNVSLTNCGTDVQSSENGRSTMKNTMVIQQHGLMETSDDLEKTISCKLLGPLGYPNSTQYKYSKLSNVTTKLDVQLGYQLLGEKLAEELNLYYSPFLVFSAFGKGIINIKDINVKNCIAHEDTVLKEDSLFFQMTHPSGCPDMSTDILSAFTVANTTEESLVAYAQIRSKSFKAKTNNIHVTCGVQMCKKECKDKCLKKKRQKDKLTAIVTHKLEKRSVDTTPSQPILRKFELRDRFLQSTIKALAEKLLKQTRQPRYKGPKIEKRLSVPMAGESKPVGKIEDLETSTSFPDSLSVEPRKISFFNVKTTQKNLSNLIYYPDNTNLLPEDEMEYFSTDESLADDLNVSTIEIPQSVDFMEDITTSTSKPEIKLVTENISEKMDILEDLIIDLNKSNKDESSYRNMTSIESTKVDKNLSSIPHKDCVPRLKFTVVMIVLGFILSTLLLVCCGLVLHIRKEKKKHLLDSFLLYSFY